MNVKRCITLLLVLLMTLLIISTTSFASSLSSYYSYFVGQTLYPVASNGQCTSIEITKKDEDILFKFNGGLGTTWADMKKSTITQSENTLTLKSITTAGEHQMTCTCITADNKVVAMNVTGRFKGNGTYCIGHKDETTEDGICDYCGTVIHTHVFTYSADGAVMTATCTEGCTEEWDETPLTLTLTAPGNFVYSAEEKEYIFVDGEKEAWTGAGLELPNIIYFAKEGSSLTENKAVNTGKYVVSITSGDTTASADFEITKAPLKITANSESITYGDAAPIYTVAYDGFVGEDIAESSLGGNAIYDCEYMQYCDVNEYPISVTGLTSNNYEINFIGGTLTVNPLPVNLNWSGESFVYDGEEHGISATITNIINEDDVTVIEYNNDKKTNCGNYTATATELSNPNYTLEDGVDISKDWTISPKPVTIKPLDISVYVNTQVSPELDLSEILEIDREYTGIPDFKVLKEDKSEILLADAIKNKGVYTITWTNPNDINFNTNYEITKIEIGTLTVNRHKSSGSVTSSYKIKFDTNGGTEMKNISVKKGQKIGTIETPQKEGFVFDCWYKDKECTKPYDLNEEVTSSTTLYAGWKVDSVRQITLKIGQKEAMVLGEQKVNDVAPIIRNDRTMLPARFVAEALGAKVEWNGEERKVLISKDNVEIIIYIDSEVAYVNGEKVILDSPAFIENDRTYTPIRFISERLNAEVEWIEETKEVVITKNI